MASSPSRSNSSHAARMPSSSEAAAEAEAVAEAAEVEVADDDDDDVVVVVKDGVCVLAALAVPAVGDAMAPVVAATAATTACFCVGDLARSRGGDAADRS